MSAETAATGLPIQSGNPALNRYWWQHSHTVSLGCLPRLVVCSSTHPNNSRCILFFENSKIKPTALRGEDVSTAGISDYRIRQRCLTCRVASPCPDHSLAHAACPCYDQDDEFQYSGGDRGDAQTAEPWTAVSLTRRRLNYLVPNPSPDRQIPLSVQKYMHRTNGMQ